MRHARFAVIAVAAWLASCASQPARQPEGEAEPPPTPVPTEPAPADEVTFAAVGDIMLGTDYPENILPDDDGVSFLASVAPVLRAADAAFGNLEGVLMDGGTPVKQCRPPGRKTSTSTSRPSRDTSPAPAAATEKTPTASNASGAMTGAAAMASDASAATTATDPNGVAPSAPATAAPDAPTGAPESTTAAPVASAALPVTTPPAPNASAGASVTTPTAPGTSPAAPTTAAGAADAPAEPPAPASDAPVEAATAPASETSSPASPSPEPPPAESSAPPSSAPQSPALDPSANPPPTGRSCYVFRSPTRYANHLRDAGFDVVSLANNHAQDFGDAGRESSMQALDAAGIRHSGRDGDIAEWTTKGRRFALVAFAPNVGSHQLNDLDRATRIVADLAVRNDIVVVSFHGGAEGEGATTLPFARETYAGEDRGDVVEFARAVIDAGADLVIGHGPHVLRAVELYRDRLVAYSLGNFATYYGISVNGIRGISGILTARLAGDGRFLDARFTSTVQIRPGGPQPDPENRALLQLRQLTDEAFPEGLLSIEDDGRITRRVTEAAEPQ